MKRRSVDFFCYEQPQVVETPQFLDNLLSENSGDTQPDMRLGQRLWQCLAHELLHRQNFGPNRQLKGVMVVDSTITWFSPSKDRFPYPCKAAVLDRQTCSINFC